MIAWFRLARLSIAAILSIAAAFFFISDEAVSETWRITNIEPSGRVHMRRSASSRSRILAYIPGDTRGLTGGPCRRNWCQIEFEGLKGWVYRNYLTPDDSPKPKPAAAQANPDLRALAQKKTLKLANSDDRPIPVYAFPSDKLPTAGWLPAETETVDGLGACVQNWCYVRWGGLIGWLPQKALVLDEESADAEETTASLGEKPPQDAREAVDKTVTTATRADIDPAPVTQPLTGADAKFYALAGVGGDSSLPMHEKADGGSRILGWIPNNAKTIKGLRNCDGKWCMVRWENQSGWVAWRHLADESMEGTQTFQVSGLPLWTPLDVLDQPSGDAAVVGTIPSYATGIVPIGGCDRTWCHIRYLGIAGWVSAAHLQPQKR